MATNSANSETILDALAVGDIDHVRLLLTEGAPLDLQKAVHAVISSGQCEALKFLMREYKLDVDKHALLHQALRAQQEDIAKWLVLSGADVNKCPLHLLVNCSVDMMSFLLQSGADVNKPKGQHGETALRVAINTGNIEKIKLLIDHGADIEAKTDANETALIYACDNPDVSPDCVKILLENGANPNSMKGNFFTPAQGAIHFVTERGNIKKLQLLLQYGAQIEARTSEGNTALILACKEYVPADCVWILLENGAYPNVRNRYQEIPLTLANERNDEKKFILLKEYGATEEERTKLNETALMLACQRIGDVECVKFLLQNNASPNLKNPRGQTAVHYAALAGDVEKLKVLVQYKSDVNSMDDNGVTPLMMACKEIPVSTECVKFLLENNALSNLTDISWQTAAHYLASSGNLQKLQLLVHHGADVNAMDEYGKTPLMLACGEQSVHIDYVRFLLASNALVNLKCFSRNTALDYATETKDMQKVKLLVQYRADMNAMSEESKATLIKTCFNGDIGRDCIKFLIQNSALPRLADRRGYTCLHRAVLSNDDELIDQLVQNQANVNAMTNEGETPLILACGREFVDAKCVRSLLEGGALPNLTDENNKTGFDFAVEKRSLEKMRLFVNYGANVKDSMLHLSAARNNDLEFLKLLHQFGADMSAADSSGQNAITLALKRSSKFGDTATVQWLIDKGVSVNQRDKYGWTPLMAAVDCGNTKIVQLLLDAGADVHVIRPSRDDPCLDEITALSLPFDKSRICNYDCAELLMGAGAVSSLPRRHNDLLHLMVIIDNCRMMSLFLTHGMAPTLCSIPSHFWLLYEDNDMSNSRVSPLTLALKCRNFQMVKYFMDNMALCPSDFDSHLYKNELRASLKKQNRTDILTLMDEFYSQPRSLFQICCVTVSNIVGGVPGRVDRINSLPLPQIVKNHLLFKNSDILEGSTPFRIRCFFEELDFDDYSSSDDYNYDDYSFSDDSSDFDDNSD